MSIKNRHTKSIDMLNMSTLPKRTEPQKDHIYANKEQIKMQSIIMSPGPYKPYQPISFTDLHLDRIPNN